MIKISKVAEQMLHSDNITFQDRTIMEYYDHKNPVLSRVQFIRNVKKEISRTHKIEVEQSTSAGSIYTATLKLPPLTEEQELLVIGWKKGFGTLSELTE